MDKDNILSEGFFEKFKKAFSDYRNRKKDIKAFSKHKSIRKAYEKALSRTEDSLIVARALEKKYGIPPLDI